MKQIIKFIKFASPDMNHPSFAMKKDRTFFIPRKESMHVFI